MTAQPHEGEKAETLAGGVASIGSDDSDGGNVRIVPIGEGDVTTGGSGKKTYWDAETLREGVENGAFDGAKLLKGRAGSGHKSMLDQADPDEIVGSAGQFSYEDGVGPVSEDGDLLDDHLEALVDAGLVEVSPDMWRVLGEYDEELGAYRVDEIIDVPYITILDRGASDGATIEPADSGETLGQPPKPGLDQWQGRSAELAETLGMPADVVRNRLEKLAETNRKTDVELEEQLSRLFTLRFTAYGEMFGQEFLDEAVDNLEAIGGISAARSESQDNPELIAIVDREAVDSLDDLNDEIVGALEETPFEVHSGFDWVEDVAWEGLSDSGEPPSDEPAESGMGDSPPKLRMSDKDELHEQLAEIRTERDQLKDENGDLEEQLAEKTETIDEKDNRIAELEQKVGQQDEEIELLKEPLAQAAAGDSMLSAEQLADRFSTTELLDSLNDADEDKDYSEIVVEQLSGEPAPTGDGVGGGDGGSLSEEDEAQAEQLAQSVMTVSDWKRADEEQLSYREYVRQEHGVDPAQCGSESELRRKIAAGGGD